MMQKLKHSLIPIAVLLLLTISLDPSVLAAMSPSQKHKTLTRAQYSEYTGKQQAWPIDNAPFAKVIQTKYGMPLYQSLPARPYEILGVVQVAEKESTVKRAVEAAQVIAADAILVCPHEAFTQAGITLVPSIFFKNSGGGSVQSLTGLLIRWKLGSGTTNDVATNRVDRPTTFNAPVVTPHQPE